MSSWGEIFGQLHHKKGHKSKTVKNEIRLARHRVGIGPSYYYTKYQEKRKKIESSSKGIIFFFLTNWYERARLKTAAAKTLLWRVDRKDGKRRPTYWKVAVVDSGHLWFVSLPESQQSHLSGCTMKIADFGLKNSQRYVFEKPSYWKMSICWTVVLYISPRKKNTVQRMNKSPFSPYLSALNNVCQWRTFCQQDSNRRRKLYFLKLTKTAEQ